MTQESELKKRLETILGRYIDRDDGDFWKVQGNITKVLDEAKKDLYSTIHDDCYWYNEGGCSEQKWTIYHEQPDDCPLRKLEKWFGDADQ